MNDEKINQYLERIDQLVERMSEHTEELGSLEVSISSCRRKLINTCIDLYHFRLKNKQQAEIDISETSS